MLKYLTAAIAYKSRDSNNFSLQKVRNAIIVNFDYIDFHQGIVIDVYHTGHDIKDIIIKGTVKGGRDLHVGTVSKNYFTEKIITPIDRIIPKPQNILAKLLIILVSITIATIIAIPVFIVMLIDNIYTKMNKLPEEFDLSNKRTS
jgi:uncharacterized membrane protein YwzB